MEVQPISCKNSYGEDTVIRRYVPNKDYIAVHRLLKEVGWVDADSSSYEIDKFFSMGLTLVGEVNGSLECITASALGDMAYLDSKLALEAVTAVVTGMPARRKGLAQTMTAQLMMQNASNGVQVSALGVFDLGFYDRLGYATAPYQHRLVCDLSDLRAGPARTPVRLNYANADAIHSALLARKRGHGGCNIHSNAMTAGEFALTPRMFGFGYRDSQTNKLSHFLLAEKEGENGPMWINWLVWDNDDQLRELLGFVASLGDQIWVGIVPQPRGVNIQDLLKRPLKMRPITTSKTTHPQASGIQAYSSWQFRIMDMQSCVAQTKIHRGEVKFNLQVADPLTKYATDTINWQPQNGEWSITFGSKSQAQRGFTTGLPTLKASIGAFSRLWGGGASAHGLAITDALVAPTELLDELDATMDLPPIYREWPF